MIRSEPWAHRVGVLALTLALSSGALAAPRFEVIDGSLLDHSTGLLWQGLSANDGFPLPVSPELGAWRVATGNELFDIMGTSLNEPIAKASDTFQAMVFFATDHPEACVLFEACFSGWFHDNPSPRPGDPAFYNIAYYQYTAIPGDSEHVLARSVTTLGSYTRDNCPDWCDSGAGLFTVRVIPEPASVALMLAGLVGLGLHRGARRLQRLG